MTDKEMIEEIAKTLFDYRFHYDDCIAGSEEMLAKYLVEQGYRKVCEPVIKNGEVVGFVNGADYVPKNLFLFAISQARKEMARYILKEILFVKGIKGWQENKQLVEFGNKIVDKIEELAKQCGIEIKEEE